MQHNMKYFIFQNRPDQSGTLLWTLYAFILLFNNMSDESQQSSKKRSRDDDKSNCINYLRQQPRINYLRQQRINICDKMSNDEYESNFEKACKLYTVSYILNGHIDDEDSEAGSDDENTILRSFYSRCPDKNDLKYYRQDPIAGLHDEIATLYNTFQDEIEDTDSDSMESPEVIAKEADSNYGGLLLARYLMNDNANFFLKRKDKKKDDDNDDDDL